MGESMKNIFIGLLFIFLNFDLNLGNMKIGLLPDFVGYFLMIKGFDELIKESEFFDKVRPWAAFMTCYTGIIYVLEFLGASNLLQGFSIILGIISMCISLFILYQIVSGVIDMEKKYQITLEGEKLKSLWTFMAISNVVVYILIFINVFAVFLAIILLIVHIIFLFAFNNTKNLYYMERDKFFHN